MAFRSACAHVAAGYIKSTGAKPYLLCPRSVNVRVYLYRWRVYVLAARVACKKGTRT